MKLIPSIDELYVELSKIDEITSILTIKENAISIVSHPDFVLTIKKKIYFNVYINDVFYDSIEDQDILESLLDILQNDYIFIERKTFFGKKKVHLIPKGKFVNKREKFLKKKNIIIYSKKSLINNKANNLK